MLLSNMTRKLLSIFVFGICNIVIVKSVNPATTIIGGITNVATSATNFLYKEGSDIMRFLERAVDKPKSIILNATRVTTDLIDSAASKGFEFKLRRFLEKFRSRMPYGIPDLGIPPLEPLTIEEAVFVTRNPEIGKVKLELKDVEIDHLSTFLVDRARLSLIGPTIAVNITVPTIYTHGDYNLSGILGNMFPLKGSGPFQVVIYGFKAYVHTVLGYSRGMYMKSFELDFSLEAIDLALENLMGDEKVSKVMNEVIREIAPEAVELIKPEILPKIQDFIAAQANDTIYHLTMREILNVLLGETEVRDFIVLP
ncbi:uncharacterized protein LOC122499207 isoform X1 [Leptopilina heterotoma]|uniref:uncharacterized protein LOC122499207 isoform X1 n=1 Tax=Leptopilina heterotoma TaxID=63436 RepID=UPI001CA911D0|nr:uncharacterized protein LOC122499207 isoform X1 [Leptopilina heterotoma]